MSAPSREKNADGMQSKDKPLRAFASQIQGESFRLHRMTATLHPMGGDASDLHSNAQRILTDPSNPGWVSRDPPTPPPVPQPLVCSHSSIRESSLFHQEKKNDRIIENGADSR